MQGSSIKIGKNTHKITQPELWAACETEEQYFAILRERQKRNSKDDAARKKEAFIAGKYYFLQHEDTDFFE